mgnify:CR=1 FL=1
MISSFNNFTHLNIRFTGTVTLKAIVVMGGDSGSSPKTMKMFFFLLFFTLFRFSFLIFDLIIFEHTQNRFTNREDIDFDNVDSIQPTQEWELNQDMTGDLEYQTRFFKNSLKNFNFPFFFSNQKNKSIE